LEAGIPARLTPAEGRKFGFTVGGAFLVLSGITWWRGHEIPMYVLIGLGSLLILGALIIPGKLGPVYRGWMKFGEAISKVTTPIFMGIVFFGVLTPTAFIKRIFGGSKLIPSRAAATYWHERGTNRRGDLKRQF
jgi:hypothetical protein